MEGLWKCSETCTYCAGGCTCGECVENAGELCCGVNRREESGAPSQRDGSGCLGNRECDEGKRESLHFIKLYLRVCFLSWQIAEHIQFSDRVFNPFWSLALVTELIFPSSHLFSFLLQASKNHFVWFLNTETSPGFWLHLGETLNRFQRDLTL